jgi:hypothetical protein
MSIEEISQAPDVLARRALLFEWPAYPGTLRIVQGKRRRRLTDQLVSADLGRAILGPNGRIRIQHRLFGSLGKRSGPGLPVAPTETDVGIMDRDSVTRCRHGMVILEWRQVAALRFRGSRTVVFDTAAVVSLPGSP